MPGNQEIPTSSAEEPVAGTRGNHGAPADARTIAQIVAHVRAHTGYDFSGYKRDTLLNRIDLRRQTFQQRSLEEYLEHLRHNGAEVENLVNTLLITSTSFFRDPTVWDAVAQTVLPALFAGKQRGEDVRVWSAGCSTGEEAYTLAMLLIEEAERVAFEGEIHLFASDSSQIAIDGARRGRYPEAIAANLTEERLARFFVKEESVYQVRVEVRQRILFSLHNLLQDPPFSKIDLVSCRNFLIYLQPEIQKSAYDAFYFALRPQGYLLLGSAEHSEESDLFLLLDMHNRIYQRSLHTGARLHFPSPLPRRQSQSTRQKAEPKSAPRFAAVEDQRQLFEAFTSFALLVDANFKVLHLSETVAPFLSAAAAAGTVAASGDAIQLVRPELRETLHTALLQALEDGHSILTHPVSVDVDGQSQLVSLFVRPLKAQGQILIQFVEEIGVGREGMQANGADSLPANSRDRASGLKVQLQQSQDELTILREEYGNIMAQLLAANEELVSTNLEYKSALQELEATKEELDVINVELKHYAADLQNKVTAIDRAHNDLQNFLFANQIATLFLDRQLLVQRFTPGAAELFNLLPSDYKRPISHLRPLVHYPQLEADARQVLSHLSMVTREVTAADGRWFRVEVRPYRTTEDRIEGVIITFVEITANKHSEQALFASEERMRLLLESVQDYAIFTLDTNGRVTSWNEGGRRLKGYTSDEIVGHSIHRFYTPEDSAAGRPEQQMEAALRVGRWEDESWRVRKDGSRFWGNEITTPLLGHDGALLGFTKVIRDLTEQRAAQESLRQRAEEFKAHFSMTTVGNAQADAQSGRLLLVNQALCEITSYTEAELLERTIWDVTSSQESNEEDKARFAALVCGESDSFEVERQLLRKDGEIRWVMVSVTVAQHDNEKHPLRLGIMVLDITERKRAEEEVRQLNETLESRVEERTKQVRQLVTQLTMSEQEERRRISAILHDDLQQRLFSLNFQLVTLRTMLGAEGVAETQEFIREIEEDLRLSVQVTRNLSVDLSTPILHDEGIFEAIRWLADQMQQQHGLKVKLQAMTTLPRLHEDLRVLLFQIVRELLFNVVKHAGVDSAEVVLAVAEEFLTIKVSDDGSGFVINSIRSQSGSQSGQGLLRIQQRLRLFGGNLEVASRPGEGTHVTLYIPLPGEKEKLT